MFFAGDELLRHYGFWDLVQRYLSMEGYNLAHDGSGYQSIMSMWNAADAIVWYLADFANVPYKTIVGGMGRLIDALHSDLQKWATNRSQFDGKAICNLGWNLETVSFERQENETAFRLGFSIDEFSPDGPRGEATVTAAKVILALPQPALKKLGFYGLQASPVGAADDSFQLILDAVAANPLCKLFLAFEKPLWGNPTAEGQDFPESFKVFTDLPLRMLYQFGKTHRCISADHDRRGCCLILAYSDSRYADYWKQLASMCHSDHRHYSETFEASMTAEEWDQFFQNILLEYGTGDKLMAQAREQLVKVTGKEVPIPGTVLFKHWSDPPYYVGWHSWNMGFKSWQISEKMVQPFGLEVPLFTCGEAFSSEQGWIEGALKSAERVLEALGMQEPSWIDKKEYKAQKTLWL